jgi:hypothetical protein
MIVIFEINEDGAREFSIEKYRADDKYLSKGEYIG